MVSLERNWCNPSSDMSLPSMEIRPAVDSMSLKSAKVRLLLPAPVRPPERYHFDYAMLGGGIHVDLNNAQMKRLYPIKY